MVYMGNICEAHKNLAENEKIKLHFDHENTISILKDDELEKTNGDLKITGNISKCIVFVDTAFVKYMTISESFL